MVKGLTLISAYRCSAQEDDVATILIKIRKTDMQNVLWYSFEAFLVLQYANLMQLD